MVTTDFLEECCLELFNNERRAWAWGKERSGLGERLWGTPEGEVVEEGGAGPEVGASRWEAVEGKILEGRNEWESLTPPECRRNQSSNPWKDLEAPDQGDLSSYFVLGSRHRVSSDE